ncbi:wax ester/triacylglycerol synthase family O-acyltransferase [Nocardia sp. NPDC059246]|uniref:wax ester/triacylglycerol synthase family O-acyltransferase n=1 Tax=unclassified Nocardia TaxID=2637762 RepID=UPI0036AC5475
MTRDRLSPMDVAFLDVEDSANRAHLFALLVFDGPALDFDEFALAIERRLPDIPRFGQRIAFVPGALHRPEWVYATNFRLRDHVGVIEVPQPGDAVALNELGDKLSSIAMDMTKPLWQMHLVTGLPDDKFAIAIKLHHSMVDGISIMDVVSTLFSSDPDATMPAARTWNVQAAPRSIGLIGRGLLDAVEDLVTALVSSVRHLGRTVRNAGGVIRIGRLIGQSPASSLNRGESSAYRHNSWLSIPLDEFKQVKSACDTTINNVMLAVITGALRRFTERRGEQPTPMFAFVPVSIREASERGTLGNRIGLTFPRLPIDADSAIGRLASVGSVTNRSEQWRQANDTAALLALGGLIPPFLSRHVNRYVQLRSGLFNLTCTNVPGPATPMYFCGRRLRSLLGSAPLTSTHALTIAALSYNGTMFVSVTADPARVPDSDGLIQDMRAELDELLIVAGRKEGRAANQ